MVPNASGKTNLGMLDASTTSVEPSASSNAVFTGVVGSEGATTALGGNLGGVLTTVIAAAAVIAFL